MVYGICCMASWLLSALGFNTEVQIVHYIAWSKWPSSSLLFNKDSYGMWLQPKATKFFRGEWFRDDSAYLSHWLKYFWFELTCAQRNNSALNGLKFIPGTPKKDPIKQKKSFPDMQALLQGCITLKNGYCNASVCLWPVGFILIYVAGFVILCCLHFLNIK